jgi:poly-gamma-glutamate synthesis protein (capsule biosynthesis protein)
MKFPPAILIISIFLISSCHQKPQTSVIYTHQTEEAKLIAVRDILMHTSVIRSGYNSRNKLYNFKGFFQEVKPIISTGDWAIANLETTMAGSELGYSGYPLFNAPIQIVDAAKWAGFNVLTTANNHALDKGEMGNFIGNQVGKYRNLKVIFSLTMRQNLSEGIVEITQEK